MINEQAYPFDTIDLRVEEQPPIELPDSVAAKLELLTPEQIELLLCDGQETLSLEDPVGDEGATLGDFVIEEGSVQLESEIDRSLLEKEIQDALATLTARESRIMQLRYGLKDGHPLTLQDVAERFGLTRERIRQIEKEAIAKLRRPDKAMRLRAFV